MKCPKCGFNSFEYHDSCKKCSSDLSGYKQTYSITPQVLPQEAKEKLAAEFRSVESATDQISDTAETNDDMFSFDLPDESPSSSVLRNDDPFNFDEPSADESQPDGTKSDDDIFADLLESTSRAEELPLASQAAAGAASVATKDADFSSEPGEFDLESFSWDDTPVAAAAPDNTEAADDFDSLFGDAKENIQK